MARTKNPQRKKPATKVGNAQAQNEAKKTKNSKISTPNNKLPPKRLPRSSARRKQLIANEDTIDSSPEETAFKESGGLKLQDIANIVIGDLKQVRVTEATFNIVEENNQTCYNDAVEVPNNGYESQTDEQSVSRYGNETDNGAMCQIDNDSRKMIEVSQTDQCSHQDDIASAVECDSQPSNELNGRYDLENSIESTNSCSYETQPEMCSTIGTVAAMNISPSTCSNENNFCLIANDVISEKTDNVEDTIERETTMLQESIEIEANKSDVETQEHTSADEEEEDFDLSIPEDKNDSLNESYDDKDWVVCDESCDENLRSLEEEVQTISLSKYESVETESMSCDTKRESVEETASSHQKAGYGPENISTCDIVDIVPNQELVGQNISCFPVTLSEIFESKVGEKQSTNIELSQFSPKIEEKRVVFVKKELKESSKSRKNEKEKKPNRKASMGRPRKRSNEKKVKDEKTDKKSSSRRRRSDRLKSKPDYNEKYEGDQLLTQLKYGKEKENCNREMKNENGGTENYVEKSSKTSESTTTFSGDPSDMPSFQQILENEYFTERSFSKDAERMICDCVLTKEEIMKGEMGCGEDCLNRLLLIECCSRCTLGDRCTNKRFQKREYAKCEAYKTAKKGYGLRVLEDIPSGTFIMEYVGEVIDSDEFEDRAMKYARGKIPHFYFMSLKSDCIIDATVKGNFSRFINHSCEPNAETQKWTVQGELRIGFFSKRDIKAGEEVTFDYQLQRYGKQAQRCYCETPSCSGWIGEDPDKQTDDDKRKDRRKKKRDDYLDWETALDEICQVGLINRHQTLSLNRLMVHAKEFPVRMQILQLIEEGHPACRRLFVDYHGLPIIWSWMVDCTPDQDELKIQLLKTLMALPITNKTILVDSKVFSLVEQWAFAVDQKLQSEALSAQSVLESVEDIASAEETPVSEMAQKVLTLWSSLREAYRIPKKERIQQMKEHEREADQNVVKPRPRRLPLYAEKLRDRYHRNRYNKEFEKIFFDRLKDKRRKESPDRSHSRDHYRNKEGNKMARMEHRYMFEMKVAREDEERRQEAELMKRRWEGEEQNYWNYYYSQQHQMVSGQYMSSVPPNSYAANHSMLSPGMLQNMQSMATSRAHSHPYYASSSSYISPNIMLTHLPPPTPSPHTPQSTPSIILPSQVNASPQTYYQNSVPISSYSNSTPPLPVPYPHQAISELAAASNTKRTEVETETSYSYDYQALQSTPLDEIPVPNEEQTTYTEAPSYEYKENNLISVTNSEEQDLSSSFSSKDLSAAIANAAAAAIDVSKIKLPPKWKTARDSEGRIYYYHTKTRISQWYPPKWEEPQQTEEVEQSDVEESSEEESSVEDEDEMVETRKRRRKYSGVAEILRKQNHQEEKESDQNFDMDAEIKENLAAMSSEFQDSDNEDYSPVTKEIDDERANLSDGEQTSKLNTPPPSTVPLITEHIISPREPVDIAERIRNKKRIRSLKEKLKKQKRQKKMMAMLNDSSSVADGSNGVNISNSISSSNSKLLTAPADTSSISDRQRKDAFRSTMANFVVNCLNPYFRSNCTTARITNYNDFKHLARKLTHHVMVKELKHCRSATELSCNSSVKHKAKEFIKKYMSRFGEVYVRPADDGNY